jgi:hypothetical protein
MNSDQTITIWKSDFKDFPLLYEATEWCIGASVQKAENFIVIRGYNPYDLRLEERFTKINITYHTCLEMAKENGWEEKVIELLHSYNASVKQVYSLMCAKLCYPEYHIKRQWN